MLKWILGLTIIAIIIFFLLKYLFDELYRDNERNLGKGNDPNKY